MSQRQTLKPIGNRVQLNKAGASGLHKGSTWNEECLESRDEDAVIGVARRAADSGTTKSDMPLTPP